MPTVTEWQDRPCPNCGNTMQKTLEGKDMISWVCDECGYNNPYLFRPQPLKLYGFWFWEWQGDIDKIGPGETWPPKDAKYRGMYPGPTKPSFEPNPEIIKQAQEKGYILAIFKGDVCEIRDYRKGARQ